MKKLAPEQIERIIDENFGFANVKEAMLFMQDEVLRINGRWIPVSERMPDPDAGEVLVWLTGGRCAFDEWHMHREDPTGMGGPTMEMGLMWRDYDFDEITHWMRLPAAPSDHAGEAVNIGKNIPFEVDTWEPDADGFWPELCTECGTPVRYGSRHSRCGESVQATPRATGCPDTMDDTARFAADELPAILKKQVS